jgi:succinoglycan biosynthesis transport protein ExoP
MDTEHDFQTRSVKYKGKQHQFSPQLYKDQPDESDGENFDLSWLFAVIRRRVPLMAAVAIVLSGISGFLIIKSSRQIVKDYEGRFRLLVEPVTAESKLARQFLLAQTGGADLDKGIENNSFVDYETLIRVLKSHKLMIPLVEQLQKQYKSINYEFLNSKLSIVRVSYEKDGKQAVTKILEVRYKDREQKKIIFVLKQVAEAYLKYSIVERRTSIDQGITFIEGQLPEMQKRVDTLQARLEKLRQDDNVFDPTIEARGLADQAGSLQKEKIQNKMELDGTISLYKTLQAQLEADDPIPVLMMDQRSYEGFLAQIQQVNSEIAQKRANYREDSSPILALREKQQELLRLARQQAQDVVLEKIATQIRSLQKRDQALAEAQSLLNKRLGELSASARQYDGLTKELEVVTESLKKFLAKREALQIDAAQQEAPWQLIVPPDLVRDPVGQPIPATESKAKKQLMLAIVLSTLLGIGVGFLVEVLNTVFHTPEEVKGATKLPLLGVIPLAKGLQKIAPAPVPEAADVAPPSGRTLVLGKARKAKQYTSSPALEAFRSLYTNIRLISPQAPVRSLAIGSAAPGDGKSTVAIHLAQTAAAIGQRVLLVDADLRRPQLHTRLGIPNVRGLSDAIVSDIGLNDLIQRSHSVWSEELPGEDNLFVLTAGPIPNDPIKLLSSKKMLYLMEQFQAFFDLVIYDTPPLAGLSDGNILAAHTDGMVMVVGIDKTDRSMVTKALDGLKISGASVLGVVANGAKG